MRQTDAFRSGSSFLNSEFSVRSGAAALIRSAEMRKFTNILFVVIGSMFYVFLSLILFPYLIVGVLCRAIPFISRRHWLVNAIAMTLPLVMRYGFGQWTVRFGEVSSDSHWLELVAALVNMAFSHIFVWAGFLSLKGFLGEVRGDHAPVEQTCRTR
jgi:hypothetical protein